MSKMLVYAEQIGLLSREALLTDDFFEYTDTQRWTKLAADAGSAVAISASAANGILSLSTGAVDNNEAMVRSTNAPWIFAANKVFAAEVLLQYSEANTDDANVAFGFSSAAGANLLLDNGLGPAANHSAAMIFKVDSGSYGTVWQAHTSNATTQTTTVGSKTAGGTSYQRLRVEGRDIDGTNMEVTFFVNDLPLVDQASWRRPIKHNVAIASAAAMYLFVYVKAGSGSEETVLVDYIAAARAR
jgi:hypothetical protein